MKIAVHVKYEFDSGLVEMFSYMGLKLSENSSNWFIADLPEPQASSVVSELIDFEDIDIYYGIP